MKIKYKNKKMKKLNNLIYNKLQKICKIMQKQRTKFKKLKKSIKKEYFLELMKLQEDQKGQENKLYSII